MRTLPAADILPHSIPRSVTNEAIATGKVCAVLLVNITAKRNSLQQRMKAKIAVAMIPGAAIQSGRLIEFDRNIFKETDQGPNHIGQVERGIDDDQTNARIEQPDPSE